jgi:hypothetical protein
MHRRSAALSILLSVLLLGSLASSATASVVRTDYTAFNFPAGFPNTGTTCPGQWISTPIIACAVGGGSIEQMDNGRWVIRDLETMAVVISTSDPGLSGFQLATLSANLNASGNGPARATWSGFSPTSELRFTGTVVGKFEAMRLDAHVVGLGVGPFAGMHLNAQFLPADTPVGNVVGVLKATRG